jgi:hypothetical protein
MSSKTEFMQVLELRLIVAPVAAAEDAHGTCTGEGPSTTDNASLLPSFHFIELIEPTSRAWRNGGFDSRNRR